MLRVPAWGSRGLLFFGRGGLWARIAAYLDTIMTAEHPLRVVVPIEMTLVFGNAKISHHSWALNKQFTVLGRYPGDFETF